MIHSEHPFRQPPDDRDPARRFRGRLASGVTIVTAGIESNRTGLTVSSLLVVEGDPALAHLVVGPTTDLWELAPETGRFIIHVCRHDDNQLADVFAGLAPSPGGVFANLNTEQTDWGPAVADLRDRAYCTFVSAEEAGWSGLIVGRIDRVEVTDLLDPMVHYRSGYRRLSPSDGPLKCSVANPRS
jgi:flavin reductase (DIM6/NTAB) family NADH-FMN oxidoreductase RutF